MSESTNTDDIRRLQKEVAEEKEDLQALHELLATLQDIPTQSDQEKK